MSTSIYIELLFLLFGKFHCMTQPSGNMQYVIIKGSEKESLQSIYVMVRSILEAFGSSQQYNIDESRGRKASIQRITGMCVVTHHNNKKVCALFLLHLFRFITGYVSSFMLWCLF